MPSRSLRNERLGILGAIKRKVSPSISKIRKKSNLSLFDDDPFRTTGSLSFAPSTNEYRKTGNGINVSGIESLRTYSSTISQSKKPRTLDSYIHESTALIISPLPSIRDEDDLRSQPNSESVEGEPRRRFYGPLYNFYYYHYYHCQIRSPSMPFSPFSTRRSEQSSARIDIFNAYQFGKMRQSLLEIKPSATEIREQSYPKPLGDLYKLVMNGLNVTKDKRSNLNFYDNDFIFNLLVTLTTEKKEPKPDDECFFNLWFNVQRLLFKWTIYMKQTHIYNDSQLKQMKRDIKAFIARVNQKKWTIKKPFFFEFDSNGDFDFSSNEDLIKCELLENDQIVFYNFASAMKYFYNDDNDNGALVNGQRRIEPIIDLCEQLKSKYFIGVNGTKGFDNNLLLKFMILMYDPIGVMKRCLSENDQLRFKRKNHFSIQGNVIITETFLEELKERGPVDLYNNLNSIQMSESIIISFLRNHQKIRIKNPIQLIVLMEKMKKMRLLNVRSLNDVIDFKSHDSDGIVYYRWNIKTFVDYIQEGKVFISSENYDQYLKLANLMMIEESRSRSRSEFDIRL